MKESEFESECKKYLTSIGFMVWKNHTEGVRTAGRGRACNPNAGIPDLCAVRLGITCFIELKTATGVLSQKQKDWHSRAYEHGLIVHVFRNLDDVKDVFY